MVQLQHKINNILINYPRILIYKCNHMYNTIDELDCIYIYDDHLESISIITQLYKC